MGLVVERCKMLGRKGVGKAWMMFGRIYCVCSGECKKKSSLGR